MSNKNSQTNIVIANKVKQSDSVISENNGSGYFFILGREADIAFAEVEAVLSGYKIHRLHRRIAYVKDFTGDIIKLQQNLGGTIKIAKVLVTDTYNDQVAFLNTLQLAIQQTTQGLSSKLQLSLTLLNAPADLPNKKVLLEGIKAWLKGEATSVRFILGDEVGLSSVQLVTQKVLEKGAELLVVFSEDTFLIGQTITVQDFKAWSKRDYGRPVSDAKRGMLPPKLARMMVAITKSLYGDKGQLTLLDPFCGEGTVLQEALALGCIVNGSDLDKNAVSDTLGNLNWYKREILHPASGDIRVGTIVQADVRTIAHKFASSSIDIIVTEPFLGNPARGQLKGHEMSEITKIFSMLLRSLLEQGAKVLKPNGVIGVVVPRVPGRFSRELVDRSLLDRCEKFGYTLVAGPYNYARPDAKIGRAIYFFRKD